MSAAETDWKEVALALAQRVNFAIKHCECAGGGMLNTETMEITGWREYMAEAMDMIPGIKVDREMLATYNLPRSKRKKAQKEIKEARESQKTSA